MGILLLLSEGGGNLSPFRFDVTDGIENGRAIRKVLAQLFELSKEIVKRLDALLSGLGGDGERLHRSTTTRVARIFPQACFRGFTRSTSVQPPVGVRGGYLLFFDT